MLEEKKKLGKWNGEVTRRELKTFATMHPAILKMYFVYVFILRFSLV